MQEDERVPRRTSVNDNPFGFTDSLIAFDAGASVAYRGRTSDLNMSTETAARELGPLGDDAFGINDSVFKFQEDDAVLGAGGEYEVLEDPYGGSRGTNLFNTLPRKINNLKASLALPAGCKYLIKKVERFNLMKLQFDALLEIQIAVKFSIHPGVGVEDKEMQAAIIQHLQSRMFRCRFNESEVSLLRAKSRTYKFAKSTHYRNNFKGNRKHWNDDCRGDILNFSIRSYEVMKLKDRTELAWYPFEKLSFYTKLEISPFEVKWKGQTRHVCFDIYRSQPDQEVEIKGDVDGLPAYMLDTKTTQMTVETERGPVTKFTDEDFVDPDRKEHREWLERLNFDVSNLKIVLMRDPLGALWTILYPTVIQLGFAVACMDIDDPGDTQSALGIPILAVGGILALLKTQLPQLDGASLLEQVVLWYSLVMLFPLQAPPRHDATKCVQRVAVLLNYFHIDDCCAEPSLQQCAPGYEVTPVELAKPSLYCSEGFSYQCWKAEDLLPYVYFGYTGIKFEMYRFVFWVLLALPMAVIVIMVCWTANRLPCCSKRAMQKAMKEYLGEALAKIIGELAKTFASELEELKKGVEDTFGGVKATLEALWLQMKEGLEEVAGNETTGDAPGIVAIQSLQDSASKATEKVGTCLKKSTTDFQKVLSTTNADLEAMLKAAGKGQNVERATQIVKAAIADIETFFKAFGSKGTQFAANVLKQAKQALEKALLAIKARCLEALQEAKQLLYRAILDAKTLAEDALEFARDLLKETLDEAKKIVEDSIAVERAAVEEYMLAYKEKRLTQLLKQKVIDKGMELAKEIFGDIFQKLELQTQDAKDKVLTLIKDVQTNFLLIKKTCIDAYNLVMDTKNKLMEAGKDIKDETEEGIKDVVKVVTKVKADLKSLDKPDIRETIKECVSNVENGLKDVVGGAKEIVKETIEEAKTKAVKMAKKVKDELEGAVEKAKEDGKKQFESIQSNLKKVVSQSKEVVKKKLEEQEKVLKENIVDVQKGTFDCSKLTDKITAATEDPMKLVNETIEAGKKEMEKTVNDIMDNAKEIATEQFDQIIQNAESSKNNIIESCNKLLEDAISEIGEFIQSIIQRSKDKVEKIWNTQLERLNNMMNGAGEEVIRKISDTITNLKKLYESSKEKLESIVKKVKDLLFVTLKDAYTEIEKAVKEAIKLVKDTFETTKTGVTEAIAASVEAVTEIIGSADKILDDITVNAKKACAGPIAQATKLKDKGCEKYWEDSGQDAFAAIVEEGERRVKKIIDQSKVMLEKKLGVCKTELNDKIKDVGDLVTDNIAQAKALALVVADDSKKEINIAAETTIEGINGSVDDSVNELQMALDMAKDRLQQAVEDAKLVLKNKQVPDRDYGAMPEGRGNGDGDGTEVLPEQDGVAAAGHQDAAGVPPTPFEPTDHGEADGKFFRQDDPSTWQYPLKTSKMEGNTQAFGGEDQKEGEVRKDGGDRKEGEAHKDGEDRKEGEPNKEGEDHHAGEDHKHDDVEDDNAKFGGGKKAAIDESWNNPLRSCNHDELQNFDRQVLQINSWNANSIYKKFKKSINRGKSVNVDLQQDIGELKDFNAMAEKDADDFSNRLDGYKSTNKKTQDPLIPIRDKYGNKLDERGFIIVDQYDNGRYQPNEIKIEDQNDDGDKLDPKAENRGELPALRTNLKPAEEPVRSALV